MTVDLIGTVHNYMWMGQEPLKNKLIEDGYVFDELRDIVQGENEYGTSSLKKNEVVVQLQMVEIKGDKFYQIACGRMHEPYRPNDYFVIYDSKLDGNINVRKIFNKIKAFEKAIEKDVLKEKRDKRDKI